jgi:hypothetical protein
MKKDTRKLFNIDWKIPEQLIVKITPEDADKVLENYNQGNRLLRGGGAKYIAAQIKSGEWVENHPQPICFSRDGKLLDGQHRIAGISLSKQAVWASVRFGVASEVMRYLDTGISRSLCDRVAFVENTNTNKIIATMISLRHQMTGKGKGKPSPETALSAYYVMPESYNAIAELHKPTRYFATGVVALAFADYHRRYGDEACDMYSELFKITTPVQQVNAIRTFLTTTKLIRCTQYPFIVSACMAYHEGREVKMLRASVWR